MLFVSVKKYKELQSDFNWVQGCYLNASEGRARLHEEVIRLHSLRTLDKECIQALLDITGVDTALGPYEKSLVDQTLNQ